METSSLSELTRPIGDRVFIDPYFLQLKPSETCYGCFFFRRGCSPSCTRHSFIPDSERGGISYENAIDKLGPCSPSFRTDKKSVIFKLMFDVREVEPELS